jgi:hypothetical protein
MLICFDYQNGNSSDDTSQPISTTNIPINEEYLHPPMNK